MPTMETVVKWSHEEKMIGELTDAVNRGGDAIEMARRGSPVAAKMARLAVTSAKRYLAMSAVNAYTE